MIQIQNGSEFEVHGVDLHTVRKINTLDLITGTKLDITIPDGKVVSLNIPKGTQPNTVFSIAQRGLPNRRGGKQGNILVKIIGETPRHLDNDDLNAIDLRLKNAKDELTHASEYKHLIVNDSFNKAADELFNIIAQNESSNQINNEEVQQFLAQLLSY